ncbi:unnamed protein product [marine sediment metagenome]|uniref:Uncharacterized protein n=1 Tax=marine sediment metagenome TaxID=412755 RepID=X0Z6B0_9ZZZZ
MTENERKWYHSEYHYDRDENGVRLYRTNYWKVAAAVTLIPAIILMAVSLGLIIGWNTNVGTPFRREVSNYVNSADEMYDPHLVIQILNRSIKGIENLGLKPTDNAAAFPWNRNYRHTPQFSIDQITSVIAYADNFIEWKEQSYGTGVIEVAADVYDKKMGHLREITANIDTTSVAMAYCLNTLGCFWYAYDWTLFFIGLLVLLAGLIFGLISSDK